MSLELKKGSRFAGSVASIHTYGHSGLERALDVFLHGDLLFNGAAARLPMGTEVFPGQLVQLEVVEMRCTCIDEDCTATIKCNLVGDDHQWETQ